MQPDIAQSRGQTARSHPYRPFTPSSHALRDQETSENVSYVARKRIAAASADRQRAGNSEGLVRRYGELVRRIAHHLARRLPPSIEVMDLIQVGMIGLLEAAPAFDAGRGASFATFAGLRIRGAMIDALRKLNWMTRSVSRKARAAAVAERAIENETGRFARAAEIAERLHVSLEDYRALVHDTANARPASLEQCDLTTVSGGSDPFCELAEQRFGAELAAAMELLPDRERLVMSLHYGEGCTVGDISTRLDVTESRVCQLRSRALQRLRDHLAGWGHSSFPAART